MSKNTDDKLTKDIACGYHMQPNMCVSVSGAFPQLTLKSSNLIQVRKSAYARKYHYQPDYGRLYYNGNIHFSDERPRKFFIFAENKNLLSAHTLYKPKFT